MLKNVCDSLKHKVWSGIAMVTICLPHPSPTSKPELGANEARGRHCGRGCLPIKVTGSWLGTNDRVILAVLLIDGDTSWINSACHCDRQWPTSSGKWPSCGWIHRLQRKIWLQLGLSREDHKVFSLGEGCCLRRIYGRNTIVYWSWKWRDYRGKEASWSDGRHWEQVYWGSLSKVAQSIPENKIRWSNSWSA